MRENKSESMTRAVLDTNILIRMAAGGSRSELFNRWQAKRFEVVMSFSTLTELRIVLARPEILEYVTGKSTQEFLLFVDEHAHFVQPNLSAPTCRDPEDTSLIATAVGGKVNFLVSADPDLLDDGKLIAELSQLWIRVMRVAEFFKAIDNS